MKHIEVNPFTDMEAWEQEVEKEAKNLGFDSKEEYFLFNKIDDMIKVSSIGNENCDDIVKKVRFARLLSKTERLALYEQLGAMELVNQLLSMDPKERSKYIRDFMLNNFGNIQNKLREVEQDLDDKLEKLEEREKSGKSK